MSSFEEQEGFLETRGYGERSRSALEFLSPS